MMACEAFLSDNVCVSVCVHVALCGVALPSERPRRNHCHRHTVHTPHYATHNASCHTHTVLHTPGYTQPHCDCVAPSTAAHHSIKWAIFYLGPPASSFLS